MATPVRPVLVLRYTLRAVLFVSLLAERVDRAFLAGPIVVFVLLPRALGRALSRVQSGSLTEYLLLVFTGLALLVVARLFA